MTQTKPRRLTQKQVDKVLRDFDLEGRVGAYLATLGEFVWSRPEDGSAPRHVILTKAGMLRVTVYDDWIACCFDEPEAGRRLVGASTPSGKWNHHAFVGYCHKPTNPAQMVHDLHNTLGHFIRGVEKITKVNCGDGQ